MIRIEDIGDSLIDARLALGLTQRELAARLGVHQQQIARWEQERYGCVALSRLVRVAAALGLSSLPIALGEARHDAQEHSLAAEAPARYGTGAIEASDQSSVRPARDLGEVVARIRAHAGELYERYGVTLVDVFGSFARGEQRPDSDVDLIVEVLEPTLETVFGPEEYLTALLGRKADAGSFASLRPRVKPYVERERVNVWRA
ncbi:MAG: helix-turn-helix domain-containing protein [Actinomycetota bacterium]|nr:MAG: DNA polymerase subunit [Actinomycetota bacterium]MDO8949599.1 helix-turn-helix domain-containing protein [Actinomycetota bacterium]MDP3630773.1 helix-turn-helix domain-containing protein [Actinomycetota bacterium]